MDAAEQIVVETSDALEKMSPTALELEAVRLRWQKLGPGGSTVPAEDAVRLLLEVRGRALDIETQAVRMMTRATSEGRWYPRRHMRFALLIVAILFGTAALIASLMGPG